MSHFRKSTFIDRIKGIIGVNRVLFNVMTICQYRDWNPPRWPRRWWISAYYVDGPTYAFKTGNENVYDAAKSGIILYCQSWKGLLKNAMA